ncbi:MAG: hypothetical protein R2799_01530 [Crocinitomicaceae bacterium]
MELEIKIVRATILSSIFFGLFNLIGQSQVFLTPFLFNYALVFLIAVYFSYRNRKMIGFLPLILFTIAFGGITLASGQFMMLVNFFSHENIVYTIPPLYEIASFVLFWGVLVYILLNLLAENRKSIQSYTLILAEIILLLAYIVLHLSHHELAFLFFILFSVTVSFNLIFGGLTSNSGYIRIFYILFLNMSLEILKSASLYWI